MKEKNPEQIQIRQAFDTFIDSPLMSNQNRHTLENATFIQPDSAMLN